MKHIKLAVVGSRNWHDDALVNAKLDKLRERHAVTHIISGGARGADQLGAEYATAHEIELVIHLPNWKVNGKGAGFLRNWTIAQDCDMMVAFWDERSHGTTHALECARKQGKPAWVINPSGQSQRWLGEDRYTPRGAEPVDGHELAPMTITDEQDFFQLVLDEFDGVVVEDEPAFELEAAPCG